MLPREQSRAFQRRPTPVPPQELPSRVPAEHSATLLSQLDQVLGPPEGEVDVLGASAAVDIAPDFKPDPVQLAKGAAAFVDAGEHSAVLYFHDPSARTLRSKLSQYGDPEKNVVGGAPRNNPLIAPIEAIRTPVLADLADPWDLDAVLETVGDSVWLELWTPGGRLGDQAIRSEIVAALDAFAEQHGVDDIQRFTAAEHDISLVRLRPDDVRSIPSELPFVTRIREPSQARLERQAREAVGAVVSDDRITPPAATAPNIAILDTGIAEDHPLLDAALVAPGESVVPGETSARDAFPGGHGTAMAGVAAFPDLAPQLAAGGPVSAANHLANVRLWSEDGEPFWASRTEEAVLAAEAMPGVTAAHLLCLSTGSRPRTPRTSWSYAVDRLAYADGQGRLICVAAGNIQPEADADAYPDANKAAELHDPAHAMNALTVAGYTALDAVHSERAGLTPVARAGELSPMTTTGTTEGPIKPDLLMEAGNACPDGTLPLVGLEELSVLTTSIRHAQGTHLESDHGTSVATATLAGWVGELAATDPALRPETIRALIVNSARWPGPLTAQLPTRQERIRCAGYGVPRREYALASAANRATLVHQGSMAPYSAEERLDALHLFRLPLPDDELLALGEAEVVLAITLSFFAEPHETRVSRYAGAMLQWDLQRRSESESDFLARINQRDRDSASPPDDVEAWNWEIGPQARRRGSVQSDRVAIEAAALAGDRLIAVYPAGGWWGDRLRARAGREMPYALVVTIDVGDADVDVYSQIASRLSVQVDVDGR